MNWPNLLTISRVIAAGVLMALLTLSFPYAKSLALVVFVLASITDYLDGYLARNVYGTSTFGKLMDPLADKIMVAAVFISFVEISLPTHPGPLVPAFLVVIIISREFMVTGLRLLAAGRGKTLAAGRWGKHKTVWQVVAIIIILLGLAVRFDLLPLANPATHEVANFDRILSLVALLVSILASVITVVSGLKYFLEHRDLILRPS
jgi:CDP-diacylglycerol--glycerol-3-phosphate 3-phosphatidyltransferase